MTRTPRPSAEARWAWRLALLLGVAACRAQGLVNAVPAASPSVPPNPASPPTSAATPTLAASAATPAGSHLPGTTSAAVPHPVDPHAAHPVLLALVRRLSEWSPELASRFAAVSLADTAAADSGRTQDYLLHVVARRLLLPTVRLSADAVLGDVAESIEDSSLFGVYSVGSRLSMKTDLTPAACYKCQDCSDDYRCTLELKRLAPAFFFEDGLGFYDDLCVGEYDFPWPPACELVLERYLDATVAAGLSRRRIEEVFFQIVQDVAQRCRTIEQPPALDPDHPLEPAQILELAHARWRAMYGTSLRGDPLAVKGAVRSTASSAEAEAARRRFECRMYREVPTTRGHARALEAYYATAVPSEESDDESSDEPLDPPLLDCDDRPAPAARSCRQVDGGVSGVSSVVGEQLEATPPPPELVIQLALALESLSLAGIDPRVLDEQYRLLARQLTASESGHRSSERR